MPKVGRPKLPPGEKRAAIAFMRVTAEEFKLLKAAARKMRMSHCEWMRAELIPAAERLARRQRD